jgi:hypothetical protein
VRGIGLLRNLDALRFGEPSVLAARRAALRWLCVYVPWLADNDHDSRANHHHYASCPHLRQQWLPLEIQ